MHPKHTKRESIYMHRSYKMLTIHQKNYHNIQYTCSPQKKKGVNNIQNYKTVSYDGTKIFQKI